MNTTKHKPGTYIRLRISPRTIKEVAQVGGQLTETIIGFNSLRVGLQMKKSMEKQAKISSALRTGKDIADIASGVASAVSKVFQ